MTTLRRFALWSLPPAALLVFGWGVRITEAQADLAAARERLTAGDAVAAARFLESPLTNAETREPARAELAALAALEGRRDQVALAGDDLVDLSPLVRRELFSGRPEAASSLADLGRSIGRAVDPWLDAAIQIELGRPESVELPAEVPEESRLARRVKRWMDEPGPTSGVLLRDRTGESLGWLDDTGALSFVGGVDPAWIPPAITEALPQTAGPSSLRTTLDLELSRLALEALSRFRGSIVLLDPQTGEILAAVSDRKTLEREGGTPALEQFREPASISKLLTTAAYLRAGHDPDERIGTMRCRGHERFDGELLYCPYIAGRLRDLDRAMALSCNVAFASLGVETGHDRMIAELRRWGFERPLGRFEGGFIRDPRNDRELADLSIGLEVTEITPLHAATLAAAIAADGVMPTPHLIAADDGVLGLSPRPRPVPAGRRVLDREWLAPLRSAMEAVVDRGTARGLTVQGFPVAMKTGTASDPRYGFHVNYIGYGPRRNARIAFVVRITNQGTSKQVRYVGKVVTGRLLRRLASVASERGWSGEATSASLPEGVRLVSSERERSGGRASVGHVGRTSTRRAATSPF